MKITALITALAACVLFATPASAHTLTYSTAKKAAQHRGDAIAGKRTRVDSLIRISRHRYYAQAKWTRTDPYGCKGCVYNEITGQIEDGPSTEYCFVGLKVTFASSRSRRVRTAVEEKVCS